MPLLTTGAGKYAVAAAGYQGLGNVVTSGWIAYYGMRAFSQAAIGVDNAVQLFRDAAADNASFPTTANGFISTANVETYRAGDTLRVQTLFDQVGTADFVQTTLGRRPAYIASGVNSTPVTNLTPTGGTEDSLLHNGVAQAQPFSLVTVAKHIGTATGVIFSSNSGNTLLAFVDGGVIYDASAGTFPQQTCSNNAWHSIIVVFQGASSVSYVDGASATSSNPGTGGLVAGSEQWALGVRIGVGQYLDGDVAEFAVYNGALSPAQAAAIYANHQTYYGV